MLPYIIVAIVVVFLILSRAPKRQINPPTNTELIKLNTSAAVANETHFFSRVWNALVIFIVSVVLSMAANWGFDKIKNLVGELSKRHQDPFLWSLGSNRINVADFVLAMFLASVASFILGKIAKSQTVYILAALVAVMISGWLWQPC
jgi:uncharacterized membrane protein YcaP (DUF421 family)